LSTTITGILSGNYKTTVAVHRAWQCFVISNGESWPRIGGSQISSSSDIYRLGIIPALNITAPTTTASGTSSAGTYSIVQVYRSTLFADGLLGDNIQSNRSNIVQVTLSASDAAVFTKVTTTDSKINKIDIYAALNIGGIDGTYYRVVKDASNSAGTITFNIQQSNGVIIGAGVTGGTADSSATILATDNDYPVAQPFGMEVNGRLFLAGGNTARVTATFTSGSSTVTTLETVYDGIEFWNLKRDSDTTGGINSRGTYFCRYASANSVTLVNADGTAATYSGSSGTETTSIWTEPNLKYSKFLNPHAFPEENIRNDYYSAILSMGKMPNTNRLLVMGKDWVVAEDCSQLPLQDGLNYISTEYGCSSHFSIVAAHGRLYWLDLGKGKREICVSDGSTVTPISTKKIKSVLRRITLDSNGDPWRIGFIAGAYYHDEDVIRWALYLDNNTSANYILEYDLNTGDVRLDPQFYAHRYLDVFTYGTIRGRVYIGQFGWTDGIARIGLDNVIGRYRDWVPSGTLSGDLDTSGQSSTVLTVTTATFPTASNGLQGIQAMVWQEKDSNGDLITNPTYYHCRISDNTSTTFTVNYVESMDITGLVSSVDVALPTVPSGTGWKFAIGVIQGMAGPKWFVASDFKSPVTCHELSVTHKGYDTETTVNPLIGFFHENFDTDPRDAQYLDQVQQAQQVSDSSLVSSTRAIPKTNPSTVLGFTLVDNNVDTNDYSLDIEAITVSYSDAIEQDDTIK
jgi:hypothetical protein